MKKVATILLLTALFACKKEDPIPEENIQLANAFTASIQQHHYRLVSYISETPFDYDLTDTVGAKTNHWQYVSYYLKDDILQFNTDGTVLVNQYTNFMPGIPDQNFTRPYKVAADHEGVRFDFMNFTYDPLTYRVISFSDSSFVVKAKYNGEDVISTFKVL